MISKNKFIKIKLFYSSDDENKTSSQFLVSKNIELKKTIRKNAML
jgi:hypothetical protein